MSNIKDIKILAGQTKETLFLLETKINTITREEYQKYLAKLRKKIEEIEELCGE